MRSEITSISRALSGVADAERWDESASRSGFIANESRVPSSPRACTCVSGMCFSVGRGGGGGVLQRAPRHIYSLKVV